MEKYNLYRNKLESGDIILYYRNSTFLSRAIMWADKAYYCHAGIVFNLEGKQFTIDAWNNGTELIPLVRRMNVYKDFCVIRKKDIDTTKLKSAYSNLIARVEKNEPYGFAEVARRLIWLKVINKNNRFAWLENWINKKRLPVCSDVARDFGVDLGIKCFKDLVLPTPQDLKRYIDLNEIELLFDWEEKKI